MIHPRPQKEWGWEVAVYLYLAGMGAGALVIGLVADWTGYFTYSARTILLWGPILVSIAAPLLILKLGIKQRFLNTVLNPRTSWLSRGFFILSLCIVVGLLILGISSLPYFSIALTNWSSPLLGLDIIGFIIALATAVYTGILIKSVRFVPLWNTWWLPALFTVSALSTGSMVVTLSLLGYSTLVTSAAYPAQLMDVLMRIGQVLMVVEVVTLVLYLLFRYRAEDEGRSSVRLLLTGNMKYLFWIGIIVMGFVLPIILEVIYSVYHDNHLWLLLTGISLLTGGLFLRFGVVYAGIKENHPQQKFIENRYYSSILASNMPG